jgi:Ser/Thr protein kinase RdoA (MazF antagonist)
LHDTLPGFHVTPSYFPKLDEALKTKEGQMRLNATKVAHNVMIFLEKRREWSSVLEDGKARGELSLRPIHGDPKTANVMIDDMTNKGTAIIDLDTVKPGLVHTDIADCLRSCCNPAGEETHDISSVMFDTDLCDAVLSGYREQAQGFLTEAEKYYLYDAVRLIAYEQALRFFADYIAGDVYYKVREDGQNLMRARVQVQLCRSIEANELKIRRMLELL